MIHCTEIYLAPHSPSPPEDEYDEIGFNGQGLCPRACRRLCGAQQGARLWACRREGPSWGAVRVRLKAGGVGCDVQAKHGGRMLTQLMAQARCRHLRCVDLEFAQGIENEHMVLLAPLQLRKLNINACQKVGDPGLVALLEGNAVSETSLTTPAVRS